MTAPTGERVKRCPGRSTANFSISTDLAVFVRTAAVRSVPSSLIT
jgi:hypothetical protein